MKWRGENNSFAILGGGGKEKKSVNEWKFSWRERRMAFSGRGPAVLDLLALSQNGGEEFIKVSVPSLVPLSL